LAKSEELERTTPSLNISSQTYGVLFLGVPKNAEDAFGNLSTLALQTETHDDSPSILALKRDVAWLRETCVIFDADIGKHWVARYFLESSGSNLEEIVKVFSSVYIF